MSENNAIVQPSEGEHRTFIPANVLGDLAPADLSAKKYHQAIESVSSVAEEGQLTWSMRLESGETEPIAKAGAQIIAAYQAGRTGDSFEKIVKERQDVLEGVYLKGVDPILFDQLAVKFTPPEVSGDARKFELTTGIEGVAAIPLAVQLGAIAAAYKRGLVNMSELQTSEKSAASERLFSPRAHDVQPVVPSEAKPRYPVSEAGNGLFSFPPGYSEADEPFGLVPDADSRPSDVAVLDESLRKPSLYEAQPKQEHEFERNTFLMELISGDISKVVKAVKTPMAANLLISQIDAEFGLADDTKPDAVVRAQNQLRVAAYSVAVATGRDTRTEPSKYPEVAPPLKDEGVFMNPSSVLEVGGKDKSHSNFMRYFALRRSPKSLMGYRPRVVEVYENRRAYSDLNAAVSDLKSSIMDTFYSERFTADDSAISEPLTDAAFFAQGNSELHKKLKASNWDSTPGKFDRIRDFRLSDLSIAQNVKTEVVQLTIRTAESLHTTTFAEIATASDEYYESFAEKPVLNKLSSEPSRSNVESDKSGVFKRLTSSYSDFADRMNVRRTEMTQTVIDKRSRTPSLAQERMKQKLRKAIFPEYRDVTEQESSATDQKPLHTSAHSIENLPKNETAVMADRDILGTIRTRAKNSRISAGESMDSVKDAIAAVPQKIRQAVRSSRGEPVQLPRLTREAIQKPLTRRESLIASIRSHEYVMEQRRKKQ